MRRKITDTTGLSRLFHLNSEPFVNEHPNRTAPFVQRAKSYKDAQRVALPETGAGMIDNLASERRSVRSFRNTPLGIDQLAALLRSGYGAIGPDRLADRQKLLRRPVPSAGGLYPLEAYALVRNVDGLQTGVYHFDCVGDDLAALSLAPWEAYAAQAFISWQHIQSAPAIICLVAVFERTQSKYGPRGYRYVLLEAGHVAQNICLSATAAGLSSLCLGGFHDGILNRVLGLDGEEEAVVYTVAVGAEAPV